MTFIEKIRMLERLDQLIRMKATGSPKELAGRLGVSERNVFRTIELMSELGLSIEFDKTRNSYSYTRNDHFSLHLNKIGNDHKIMGGFFYDQTLHSHIAVTKSGIQACYL